MKQKTTNCQYIWFIGPGACGKSYTVRNIHDHEDHILRARLNLRGKVKVSDFSLLTGGSRLTPRDFLRHLVELDENDTSILIKWQQIDTKHRIPQKLRDLQPEADHRVVALYIAPSDLVRRCQVVRTEFSQVGEDTHMWRLRHSLLQVNELRESGLPATWIDSSDPEYGALRWLEVERRCGLREWFDLIRSAAKEVRKTVPPGEAFILVDQDKLGNISSLADRRRIPFLERNGQYFGLPANAAVAWAEFERVWRKGVSFIVFAWPAFWWLDYYKGFQSALRSRFRCVLENERLVVFDLALDRLGRPII